MFHTVRQGNKYLKKSRYLGKELPKDIEKIKQEFLEEIRSPEKIHYAQPEDDTYRLAESLTLLERKILPLLKENHFYSKLI